MGIKSMSEADLLAVKKCSKTVVSLDIMLGLSTARLCSLKRS